MGYALHPSPGWSAKGWKGTMIGPFFFHDPGCFDDATDNPHVFLSGHLMTNMGKYLGHCQGTWRKRHFQEPLRIGMTKNSGEETQTLPSSLLSVPHSLFRFLATKISWETSLASACLLSPEAISSTSNSFILMRKKFYSPALGISLEVDSANGEAWLGVWVGIAKSLSIHE